MSRGEVSQDAFPARTTNETVLRVRAGAVFLILLNDHQDHTRHSLTAPGCILAPAQQAGRTELSSQK